jgi:hypothetical protein
MKNYPNEDKEWKIFKYTIRLYIIERRPKWIEECIIQPTTIFYYLSKYLIQEVIMTEEIQNCMEY